MSKYPRYKLDVRSLVEDLGGRRRVVARLREMGVRVDMKAIDKARERGSLHGTLLVNLIAHVALDEKGKTIDLPSYLTEVVAPPLAAEPGSEPPPTTESPQ